MSGEFNFYWDSYKRKIVTVFPFPFPSSYIPYYVEFVSNSKLFCEVRDNITHFTSSEFIPGIRANCYPISSSD
jgi:hypothetical protein